MIVMDASASHIAMVSPCLIIPMAPDAPSVQIAQIGAVLSVLSNLDPEDFRSFIVYIDQVRQHYTTPAEVSGISFTRRAIHAMLEVCEEAALARQEAASAQK